MLRWVCALSVLAVITGLMTGGLIPTLAVGLARILFTVYVTLLAVTLIVGVLRA